MEAFSVIREAMAAQGVAGLGRAVISRRERLLVMEPRGNGILATLLHYNYEVRDDKAYFDSIPDIKIPAEMLDLAKHIIQTKLGHFDISKFEDRYENALVEMIRAKQAGRPVEVARPAQPTNVINLMDALRRSIAADKGGLKERMPPEAEEQAPRRARKTAKQEDEGTALRHAAQARRDPKRVERVAAAKEPGATRAKAPRKTGGR